MVHRSVVACASSVISNNRGKAIAVRMPSSTTTTINSIVVKPSRFDDVFDFFTLVIMMPTLSAMGPY